MPSIQNLEEQTLTTSTTSTTLITQKWPTKTMEMIVSELKIQRGIALPMIVMNLTWFAKIAITTAFLGHLGPLKLAGGALGFTFANVTGFSVLNGLCSAMEPICGQAHGAKNTKLLHKTLVMTTFLLLLATLPISFLWLHVDKILVHFRQQKDISLVAKNYLFYLLPDLILTSFLCPLKSYLSSQNVILPIMISSGLGLAFHIPITIWLSKVKDFEGVAMAVWISDLIVVILLLIYVIRMEIKRGFFKLREGGWFDQSFFDWVTLIKLCGPCCLTTCLEWWCYEILVLLSGRLPMAKQSVSTVAILLNFDYLLYAIMLSLATTASIRVSNELGADRAGPAHQSARVSVLVSVVSGIIGGAMMVSARGFWGRLYSHDEGTIRGVKKMIVVMAFVEVVNFPLAVSGGIVRGTARPWLAMYANLGGFYLVALPLCIVFAFRAKFGLGGLLLGFLVGMVVCLCLILVFVARIDWGEEAKNAQLLACGVKEDEGSERLEHTEDEKI